MLDTIMQQVAAFGVDAWKTMSLVAELAWSWILAQPLWLTLGVGGLLKAALPTVMLMRWWKKKKRAAKAVADRPRVTLGAKTPVQTAAIMAARGVAPVEIARQTRLSRDAIALVTRQDRPVPALVAGNDPGRRLRPELVAHG